MGLIKAALGAVGGVMADQWEDYFYCEAIPADTLVVKDGRLLGKPKDKQDAVNMLNTLKHDKHQVITSIAVLIQKDDKYEEYLDCDITDV